MADLLSQAIQNGWPIFTNHCCWPVFFTSNTMYSARQGTLSLFTMSTPRWLLTESGRGLSQNTWYWGWQRTVQPFSTKLVEPKWCDTFVTTTSCLKYACCHTPKKDFHWENFTNWSHTDTTNWSHTDWHLPPCCFDPFISSLQLPLINSIDKTFFNWFCNSIHNKIFII